MAMDAVDFEIFGNEMQYVEVELDPNEAVVAEAGAMMYMTDGIEMETVFGDGRAQTSGWMGALMSAGKRVLSGENMFSTVFHNTGATKSRVAFAAPYPGKIIPIHLDELGGTLICQRDAFLCAAKGVGVSIAFQKKMMTGLFGGEGFIMQKLEGEGLAFIHAGGTICEKVLNKSERLRIDTGCVVAYEQTVDFDVQYVGNLKSALFSGEGMFFATLKGPGRVWLQSLPFSRLAGRILVNAPQHGGHRETGGALGILGDMLKSGD